jgi:hypothetical protein
VTVVDTTAPVVTAPAAVSKEATSPQTAVDIGIATGTDLVGPVALTSDAPATYPVGTTTVTWTATDAYNNFSTTTQTVTVVDTTAPVVTAPVAVSKEATSPQTAVDIGIATGTDLVGPVALTSDAPATYPVGTTTVTWTATDAYNNFSTTTQTVRVVDTTAPSITSPGDVTVEQFPIGDTVVDIGTASAIDLVGVTNISNNKLVSYQVGTTTVIWTATDAAGNSSSVAQMITVTALSKESAKNAEKELKAQKKDLEKDFKLGMKILKDDKKDAKESFKEREKDSKNTKDKAERKQLREELKQEERAYKQQIKAEEERLKDALKQAKKDLKELGKEIKEKLKAAKKK